MPPRRPFPYDPRWADSFAEEAAVLRAVLAPWLVDDVHHVGSTSIPGMAAKPVIDMIAGVRDLEESRAAFGPLLEIGYGYREHRKDAHAFFKPPNQPTQWEETHHLHLTVPGSDLWRERLAFRDALREDPALAAEYTEWKLRHYGRPSALGASKRPFVQRVLASKGVGLKPDDERLTDAALNARKAARMELVYGDDDAELRALLDESLEPRSPDFLLELAAPLLRADSRLLDVGCRDARHLIPLVSRSGCTGVGIDPIDRNVDHARTAVTAAELEQRIEIRHGVMEQTGEPDDSVDVVWCRDVLEVVPDLDAGLAELVRVLKPGGAAVIYTVFTTPRLEPREAAAFEPLGNVPRNLERAWVEAAFEQAGLRVERVEEIGTEFREYDEERTRPVSDSLLRLARLRRRREEIVERFGSDKYAVWEASLHWLAYLLLGKLEPVAYVLRPL